MDKDDEMFNLIGLRLLRIASDPEVKERYRDIAGDAINIIHEMTEVIDELREANKKALDE